MFALVRSIMKDGSAPYQYLSGGSTGKWIWTLLPDRALCWPAEQQAELMLTEIGRPRDVMVRPLQTNS
jgi:hypothetical protein